MSTLTINTKFDRGDKAYIIRQEKESTPCPICEGVGKIEYKGKLMTCPECRGDKVIVGQKTIYRVQTNPYVIRSMKISICGEHMSISYKGDCNDRTYNRAEESLYSTIEEAQSQCNYLNKNRKYINLSDIVINSSFAHSIPAPEKIAERLSEYKADNRFKNEIVIDSENVLRDGYTTYLVCKMLDISLIKAIVE